MNITIDGIEYVPTKQGDDVRIVVLQRGWVLVGYYSQGEKENSLTKAAVIRSWGTSKGLGEIQSGPTNATKLDPCNGTVYFHPLTEVLNLKCEATKWAPHLK